MSKIKDQVKLPLSVALEVVLQGIRIRLGRSVVTMLGVSLGIAFLMSILTGQEVKKGVSSEEDMRRNVSRMYNFLVAEIGPPRDRVLGVIVAGPLNEAETRFLRQLDREGLRPLRLVGGPLKTAAGVALDLPSEAVADPAAAAIGANAVIVIGDGAAPAADWATLLASNASGRIPLCLSRATMEWAVAGIKAVRLERQLQPDEIEQMVRDAERARFRNIWIIIISLAVTVICITNSMLMSVTERFREIGTMKCLGALSSFIRQIFLIESSLTGLAGSILGIFIGAAFSILAYGVTFGFGLVFAALSIPALALSFVVCLFAGILLSVLAALYPANIASRMVPANALRSNI